MSNSNHVLLDKNVARNYLAALVKLARSTPLEASEQVAFDLLNGETLKGKRIFIVEATDTVLEGLQRKYPIIHDFRDRVEIMVPARYFKRWARRLQEFGFTREDARVLSLGTFGTDAERSLLGVDEVLTFDRPMSNLFAEKKVKIQQRLDAFKREVEPPYNDARLPILKWLGALARKKK